MIPRILRLLSPKANLDVREDVSAKLSCNGFYVRHTVPAIYILYSTIVIHGPTYWERVDIEKALPMIKTELYRKI